MTVMIANIFTSIISIYFWGRGNLSGETGDLRFAVESGERDVDWGTAGAQSAHGRRARAWNWRSYRSPAVTARAVATFFVARAQAAPTPSVMTPALNKPAPCAPHSFTVCG